YVTKTIQNIDKISSICYCIAGSVKICSGLPGQMPLSVVVAIRYTAHDGHDANHDNRLAT
ncbi:MAG: hypothetical protein JW910_18785, partial [Anaerolineae bacterium]|nr:hypothetical protein [Anaerolineae bacterium]